MSMVRGKLEAFRDVSQQSLTAGEVLFIEKEGRWYNASEPSSEVKVAVLSLEDLQSQTEDSIGSAEKK